MHQVILQTRSKKRAFTLLELMICIALIGLLGSILGIKGADLLSHHRFHSSLQTWLFATQRLQILSMNQGADVICTIKKDKDGHFKAFLESDSPTLASEVYELKEVFQISFENKPVKEFHVTFFSSGRIFPTGLLKVETSKENETPLFLDLSYPVAFQSKNLKRSHALIPPPYPERRNEESLL